MLENDRNIAAARARGCGARALYHGQWNDDYHHAAHVVATGEDDGYYGDYADDPSERSPVRWQQGFVYQGEPSAYRDGAAGRAERRICRRRPSCLPAEPRPDRQPAMGERLTRSPTPDASRR